ncbi:MAG: CHAT domain-containing protein [Anaerolineales bacterium]
MNEFIYHDCVLEISSPEEISIEYTEEGRTFVIPGKLSSDPFAYLTVERLNNWVNYALRMQEQGSKERLYDMRDLQVIGLNLYSILFDDEKIRELFNKTYQSFDDRYREMKAAQPEADPPLRLRLKLIFKKPAEDLGRLPWEFLFIPGQNNDIETGFFFSGQKTELILTRFVPDLKMPYEVKDEKLRILLVISRAETRIGKLDERETQELVEQVQGIPHAVLTILNDPTYQQLSDSIETDVKPHILHFIGHGKPGALAIFKGMEDEDYDFDMDQPQVRWITSKEFKDLFIHHKPRLIFLHACKGAAPESHEGFTGTARELVYAEIPAVVAMQYNISNQDAGVFARTFYEELGKGSKIDEAVKAGRIELGMRYPRWAHPRFGTPVVYLQNENAIVSVPLKAEEEAETAAAEPAVTPGAIPTTRPIQGESRGAAPERSAPAVAETDRDQSGFGR